MGLYLTEYVEQALEVKLALVCTLPSTAFCFLLCIPQATCNQFMKMLLKNMK